MEYTDSVTGEHVKPEPLRKLVLLKEAMTRVADRLQQATATVPAPATSSQAPRNN